MERLLTLTTADGKASCVYRSDGSVRIETGGASLEIHADGRLTLTGSAITYEISESGFGTPSEH